MSGSQNPQVLCVEVSSEGFVLSYGIQGSFTEHCVCVCVCVCVCLSLREREIAGCLFMSLSAFIYINFLLGHLQYGILVADADTDIRE